MHSPDDTAKTALDPLVLELPVALRRQVLEHLLSLSPEDRRFRFGTFQSDESLRAYVGALDFVHDVVLGVVDSRANLLGFGHLAYENGAAEFGLSVAKSARGHGVGLLLVERAMQHARAHGADEFVMHFRSDNEPLRRLAARAGLLVEHVLDEPMARLKLPVADCGAWLGDLARELGANLQLSLRRTRAAAGRD